MPGQGARLRHVHAPVQIPVANGANCAAAADLALAPELASRLDELTREFRYGDAVR